MALCPHCKRPLNLNNAIHLTRRESQVYDILLSAMPDPVDRKVIAERIGIHPDNVSVLVNRLRAKLEPHGMQLRMASKYYGYELRQISRTPSP